MMASLVQIHNSLRRQVLLTRRTINIVKQTVTCLSTSQPAQPSNALYGTSHSATGFNDYEEARKNFKIDVPEYFNFASDVIDYWALQEKKGARNSSVPAFWWTDTLGRELQWNFQQLSENSKRVATFLSTGCEVKPGDRIFVILQRIPQWWLINIAAMRIGAVLIPGTPQLTRRDIETRIQQSGATCLIVTDGMIEKVESILKECPSVKSKISVNNRYHNDPPRGWMDFTGLYTIAEKNHKCVKTKSDEPMTIFFTSGTTGRPKMAEHTHASYGLGHTITGKYWLDLTPTDIHWNLSDLGWAKSAWSNLFAPWTQGACVFVHDSRTFDPIHTLEVLCKYPITTFCTAPTVYRMMIQDKSFSKVAAQKALRHTLSAGEPLNPEVIEKWYEGTGHVLREGYGQSETVLQVGSFRCIPNKPGSMGKPAPGVDVRIINEKLEECADGEEGDIAIKIKPDRPVGLFTRYVDDDEQTAEVFRGDYYVCGDRAIRDEDGYIFFVGRADDVIISSGYRIGPFEVESVLMEHEAVAECACVSSPDADKGEVVKAFVVLTPTYKSFKHISLVGQLQEFVRNVTAPYKYPRKIEFVESLPKTLSGKVRRVELKNKEWKHDQGH